MTEKDRYTSVIPKEQSDCGDSFSAEKIMAGIGLSEYDNKRQLLR